MIVPSVDISGGSAVQLIGGETLAVDAGDPFPHVKRFGLVGEVAVIDIDAARGEGDNRALITELCRESPIRVGGGIRDRATAEYWLEAGAEKVIIGTAADPGLLGDLPRDRLIVALDTRDGKVVTHGWRRETEDTLIARIVELRELCWGFLVTFVEREGLQGGTDLQRAELAVSAAGGARVTIAGGVTTPDEIRRLDRIGADAQVGMALYTGKMSLADAYAAPMVSDREDGLWPTIVVDEAGHALGLAWSSGATLAEAIESRRGVYHSRTRGRWVKGETSGATQRLLRVDADCDRDALRFTVVQEDGFCHLGSRTCWGADHGVGRLFRRLADIADERSAGNTTKLLDDPVLLAAKLREEAGELAESVTTADVVAEAADLLYFTAVKAVGAEVRLRDIEKELDIRERALHRREMAAKHQEVHERGETS